MKNVKKKYTIAVVFVLSISLIALIVVRMNVNTINNHYEVLVYEANSGYGYSITYKEKLLIKQDYIPVIQNVQPFYSYNDALKVGGLVKEKLKNKENPKVSLIDLKQLKIKLN
ncbi:DUF4907 domain-containing protein [Thalassobellus citreus]|uniref:DUF4907 domain-containing protein n=1 Tax=Thalassobellus citreus TaxID=3367752 RepID=UPI00378D1BDC